MKNPQSLLEGGDLRMLLRSSELKAEIKTQKDFDQLFACLSDKDRLVVMRAADVIEKITRQDSKFLRKHKTEILPLAKKAVNKELQWHLAQLIPRLDLSTRDFSEANPLLLNWLENAENSRIVRVCALQSFFDLNRNSDFDFERIFRKLEKENIPSVNARIKLLRKEIHNR